MARNSKNLAAWQELPEKLNLYNFVYENELTERVDRVHKTPCHFLWIDAAWATMMMRQGLLPQKNVPLIAETILGLWENNEDNVGYGFGQLQEFIIEKHGLNVGGSLTLTRTIPPLRQTFPIRQKLMKTMSTLLDLREALIDTAQQNVDAVMPGYTHLRHAQPTTFGHYLMSVADPLERIWPDIERGLHLMSLNELGCGALAGTSFDIDRDLTSEYLGLDGLIENTNDAVAYHDGYVQLASSITNVMSVMSRLALELNVWSTLEYDFLFVPFLTSKHKHQSKGGKGKSHSHLMPNKTGNAPYLERMREGASEALGALVEVASMGMRTFQGDMHEMLQFHKGVSKALDAAHQYCHVFIYTLPRMTVKKDNMLATARRGYSCATELAGEIVRRHGCDYRTAHMIVNDFVVRSEEAGIHAMDASVEMLRESAGKVLEYEIDISEDELQNILDPVETVERCTSRGGPASGEVKRMIERANEQLAEDRVAVWKRIEKLEDGQKKMLNDLRKFVK